MAWQDPVINWQAGNGVKALDFNRIEGNHNALMYETFDAYANWTLYRQSSSSANWPVLFFLMGTIGLDKVAGTKVMLRSWHGANEESTDWWGASPSNTTRGSFIHIVSGGGEMGYTYGDSHPHYGYRTSPPSGVLIIPKGARDIEIIGENVSGRVRVGFGVYQIYSGSGTAPDINNTISMGVKISVV